MAGFFGIEGRPTAAGCLGKERKIAQVACACKRRRLTGRGQSYFDSPNESAPPVSRSKRVTRLLPAITVWSLHSVWARYHGLRYHRLVRYHRLMTRALLLAVFSLCTLPGFSAGRVNIVYELPLDRPARHGLSVLERALQAQGFSSTEQSSQQERAAADYVVLATLHCPDIAVSHVKEALAIRRTTHHGKPALMLCGADSRGLMYAELDAAARIAWARNGASPFSEIHDTIEQPYVRERGVSMYTMQRAYFESRLYDEEQWKRYFDMLAASRINSFVVIFGYENGGFLAPAYPYFFDVDEFPGVRLVGITPAEQAKNTAAFNLMIRLAHERGIDVIAGLWDHIYRGGVQGGGIPGASQNAGKRVPGLVFGLDEKSLEPYTKAALQRFLETFPGLDALQFRMHNESGLKPGEMQPFWHEVFKMMKLLRPNLRIDLRAKDLPHAIIEDALDQGLNARVSTKYWMEQMGLPFHPTHVNVENQHDRRHGYADLLRYPQRHTVHWPLWTGGTARLLLWGDPDYVRRFASTVHLYDGDSFEVNEMLATKMLGEPHDEKPLPILNPRYRYYDYEFERYWHFYQLWGRLTYNPNTAPELWEREFQRRFGRAAADAMSAVHLASWVLPRIVASSYRYQLFPTTRGWAEMMRQGDLPQFAGEQGSDIAQFLNVKEEAHRILEGADTALRRPEDSSRWFLETSSDILTHAQQAERVASGKAGNELLSTLADVKILARLAEYHAWRLRAGVAYNLYKESGDLFAFDDAIAFEKNAIDAWGKLVEASGDVYSKDLAFGVHAAGFPRHWSEELVALRQGLVKLETERGAAHFAPPASGPRIAHVPVRLAEQAGSVRIRATAGSRAGMKQVVVKVTEGERSTTIPMRESGAGMYQAEIQFRPDSPIQYSIEASDTAGNRSVFPATGENIRFITASNRQPKLVLQQAPKATPGNDLLITAKADAQTKLKSLRLRFRHLTQYEDYETTDMQLDPATGLYAGKIPGAYITSKWDLIYYLEAIDQNGHGRIYPDLDLETPYLIVAVRR
jgi:hypothetical protein